MISKEQLASDRAAKIRDVRVDAISRRTLPEFVASRTIVVDGKPVYQVLMDFGKELGRGHRCWVPYIRSAA